MDLDREVAATLSGRSALVTGAAGFIASHLADQLVAAGADVHLILRPTSRPGLQVDAATRDAVTIHYADLTDPIAVRRAVKEFGARAQPRPYVFHLAAQAHVGESWIRPVETFMSNALGTLYLLQALVDEAIDPQMVDIAGTSEEFGNVNEVQREAYTFRADGTVVFDERSPLNPQSPYATSKVASDFLGMNYFEGYGLPVVTTRMFNNFGPRQNPRYFTGTVICQALTRDRVVMGDPDATRDYTFVLDGVRGHCHAVVRGEPGNAYVFGHGEDVSNRAWAELILEVGRAMGAWDVSEIVVDPSRFRPGASEIKRLGVDYTDFEKKTGWRPGFTREAAIERTITYYAEHLEQLSSQFDW